MDTHEYTGTKLIAVILFLLLAWTPAIAQDASANSARFAIIGDFGTGLMEHEGYVASMVSSWGPDFIITTGDNRYGAIVYDVAIGQFYCDFLSGVGSGSYCTGDDRVSNAFFPCLGNHDYTDGYGVNSYLDYFTLPGSGIDSSNTSGSERYYDFIKGPVHFFVIDSQRALISTSDKTSQMKWLQAQLAASTAPWQVVYFHHPPYSSATHGSNPTVQWPFASWGADVVVSGHDHTYERISANRITYFVNGLGGRSIYTFNDPVPGSQVRYNGDYGAMLVEADKTSIRFKFINLSGSVVDAYTIHSTSINPVPLLQLLLLE